VLSDFFASVYVPKSNDELPVLQDKDIFKDLELPHIDCNGGKTLEGSESFQNTRS